MTNNNGWPTCSPTVEEFMTSFIYFTYSVSYCSFCFLVTGVIIVVDGGAFIWLNIIAHLGIKTKLKVVVYLLKTLISLLINRPFGIINIMSKVGNDTLTISSRLLFFSPVIWYTFWFNSFQNFFFHTAPDTRPEEARTPFLKLNELKDANLVLIFTDKRQWYIHKWNRRLEDFWPLFQQYSDGLECETSKLDRRPALCYLNYIFTQFFSTLTAIHSTKECHHILGLLM